MKKIVKTSSWQVLYLVLCEGIILLLSSCFFRPLEEDAQGTSDATVHVRVNWGKYSKPEGEWLIFYPENRSLKPFSREVGDDVDISELSPGKYRLLMLGMNKVEPKVKFSNMDDPGDAMIELLEAGHGCNVIPQGFIFSSVARVDITEKKGQLLVLSPYPLVLKTCFEMPVIPGKKVKTAEAYLTGFINSLKLFTMEADYADPEHYFELISAYKEDRVCFEGKMLLPFLHDIRNTRAAGMGGKTILKMNFTYDDGEEETITTDVTQAIEEVAAEAPVEVTFNLLKIGTTAMVVSWVAETGGGSVI